MRDDLKKLPLPPEAKSYARRKGLAAMKQQPQTFINMVAAVTNQKQKKQGFKNSDEAGRVPHAIKEHAKVIVAFLTETEGAQGYFEYKVYPDEAERRPGEVTYNIQVPHDDSIYVNKVWVPEPLDEAGIKLIEQRMRQLATQRRYPTGSFFVTPWASYLIHGGTVGRI